MAEITKHQDRAFSWADLTTTDIVAARAFLQELFGWEMVEYPAGEGNTYTMCLLDGKTVAGVSAMQPEMAAAGAHSHWAVYINVEDLDAQFAQAVAAGGEIVAPPFDVMESGRMAVLRDPTGANFALWEAGSHIGAESYNVPGTIAWNELMTDDTAAAAEFYKSAFGWGAQFAEMAAGHYTMFTLGEAGVCGMMERPEGVEVPPHWDVYFNVFDVAESAAKAQSLGAQLLTPIMTPEGVGTLVLIYTPAIGSFYLFKSAN